MEDRKNHQLQTIKFLIEDTNQILHSHKQKSLKIIQNLQNNRNRQKTHHKKIKNLKFNTNFSNKKNNWVMNKTNVQIPKDFVDILKLGPNLNLNATNKNSILPTKK